MALEERRKRKSCFSSFCLSLRHEQHGNKRNSLPYVLSTPRKSEEHVLSKQEDYKIRKKCRFDVFYVYLNAYTYRSKCFALNSFAVNCNFWRMNFMRFRPLVEKKYGKNIPTETKTKKKTEFMIVTFGSASVIYITNVL